MPTATVYANGGMIGQGQSYNVQDILRNYGQQQPQLSSGAASDLYGTQAPGGYYATGPTQHGNYGPNGMWNNPYGPNGNGGGGGGGGGMGSIMDLLHTQQADNLWARNHNEANWNMARDNLMGVNTRYGQNSAANGSRGLVNNLLANPEAINDRVQNLIQNRAAGQIDAASNAQRRNIMGQMAANGQMDSGSIAAMQERLGRTNLAQRAATSSNLDIQRANQRNGDIQNAIRAGQAQAGQDTGVDMGVASTLIQNLPQYRADNYSGWIAGLQGNQGGYGGGGNFGMGGGGSGQMGGGSGSNPWGQFHFQQGEHPFHTDDANSGWNWNGTGNDDNNFGWTTTPNPSMSEFSTPSGQMGQPTSNMFAPQMNDPSAFLGGGRPGLMNGGSGIQMSLKK